MSKARAFFKNKIVETVVAGLTLAAVLYWVPSVRVFFARGLIWLWTLMTTRLAIPLWLMLLMVFGWLSIVGFWARTVLLRSASLPEHFSYTEDNLFGTLWRWRWNNTTGDIYDLACFCSNCDGSLVYSSHYHGKVTSLFCEHCNEQTATFEGKYTHLENRATRELVRRIRTGEYKRGGVNEKPAQL